MSKLVSFMGYSDPIRNYHDGPFLHILRHYEDIDKAYVFLSDKLYAIHENSEQNYYRKTIDYFNETKKRNVSVEYIQINSNDVSDYDGFFDLVNEKIQELLKDNSENIYLNVSSGTPQMQFGMILNFHFINNKRLKAIQVKNFKEASKEQDESRSTGNSEYFFDDELQNNEDDKNSLNRCHDIKLVDLMKNNIIKKIESLLDIYEYEAILDVLDTNYKLNQEAIDLIKFMNERMKQNYEGANRFLPANNTSFFKMYKNKKIIGNENARIFEYYLILKAIYAQTKFNDFIIKFDIFIINFFMLILENIYDFKISSYIDKNNKIIYEKLRKENIDLCCELDQYYCKNGKGGFNDSEPSVENLLIMVEYFEVKKSLNIPRKFLDCVKSIHKIRNDCAHKLVMIDEKEIIRRTKSNDILRDAEELIIFYFDKIENNKYNKKYFDGKYFNEYQEVNKLIKKLLNIK